MDGIVFDIRGNRRHQRATGQAPAPHHAGNQASRLAAVRRRAGVPCVLCARACAQRPRNGRHVPSAGCARRSRHGPTLRRSSCRRRTTPTRSASSENRRPELIVARCKSLLKEQIFSIPRLGTFVMHPGICPEYRNAHGCFWALANGDRDNVGMTLLRIDRGVDTGPVFGYFRVKPEPRPESHVVVEHRVVLDHLDAIRDVLLDIERRPGRAHRHEWPPLGGMGSAVAERAPANDGCVPTALRRERRHARTRTRPGVLAWCSVIRRALRDAETHHGGSDVPRHRRRRRRGLERLSRPRRGAIQSDAGAIRRASARRSPARPARPAPSGPTITFDDGGVGALTAAAILERYGLRGHFLLTANYIGTPGFLNERDIRDLHSRGHLIGSHSCSHPLRMGHCSPARLVDEWTRSRDVISNIVGEAIAVASVPGGDYAPAVAEAAARAGFTQLFTSEPTDHPEHVFGLELRGRFTIYQWTDASTVEGLACGQLAAARATDARVEHEEDDQAARRAGGTSKSAGCCCVTTPRSAGATQNLESLKSEVSSLKSEVGSDLRLET